MLNNCKNRTGLKKNRLTIWLFLLIFIVFILFVHPANGSVNISQFPYLKPIQISESHEKQIGSFVLDDEIFTATDNNYVNMRILTQDDVEVPFLVRPKIKGMYVLKEYRISMGNLSLELLSENRSEMIFEKKEADSSPGVIEFLTRQRNFEKQVTVSGSNDRKDWEVLIASHPIFDYSRYIDLSNVRVEFPPRQFTFYKIEIWNITETYQSPLTQIIRETKGEALHEIEKISFQKEDFRIDEIKFIEKRKMFVEGEKTTQTYKAENLHVAHDTQRKETVVVFRTARQPLTSMAILTGDSNFSRTIIIEGNDDTDEKTEWCHIKSAHISRINTGRFYQEQTTADFEKPCRFLQYRITIQDFDNPPLDISRIEVKGEVHEVLFFSKPQKTYRLLYGGKDIPGPRYDIGEVLRNAKDIDTDIHSVGRQEQNHLFLPSKKKQIFDGRRFFIAALVLMVGVLSWILVIVSKRVDQTAHEQSLHK